MLLYHLCQIRTWYWYSTLAHQSIKKINICYRLYLKFKAQTLLYVHVQLQLQGQGQLWEDDIQPWEYQSLFITNKLFCSRREGGRASQQRVILYNKGGRRCAPSPKKLWHHLWNLFFFLCCCYPYTPRDSVFPVQCGILFLLIFS